MMPARYVPATNPDRDARPDPMVDAYLKASHVEPYLNLDRALEQLGEFLGVRA